MAGSIMVDLVQKRQVGNTKRDLGEVPGSCENPFP